MINADTALIRIGSELQNKYGQDTRHTISLYPETLSVAGDGYTKWDLNYLLDSKLIFHYQSEKYKPRNPFGYRYQTYDIYGLTFLGWKRYKGLMRGKPQP